MELIELFKIPEKAKIDSKIKIKDIVNVLELSGKDKSIFEKSIGSIEIIAQITEKNSGIWAFEDDLYKYNVINVFVIKLKTEGHIKIVNEYLHKPFGDPCIFIYEYGQKHALSTALKHINKVDNTKAAIDDIQLTELFSLNEQYTELFSKISYKFKNLKDFYEYIDNLISSTFIIEMTDKVPNVIDNTIKEKSLQIQQLLSCKKQRENDLKTAVSVREKMELNSNIKDIEKQLIKIQEEI